MEKMTMPRRLLQIGLVALLGLASTGLLGCQTDTAGANTNLADANRELRRQNNELQAALDQTESERAALQGKLDSQPANPVPPPPEDQFGGIEGVDSFQQGSDLHVRVSSDVLFAPGKAKLRESAKKTLNEVISVLQSEYAGKTIRVEGYTDTDPIKQSGWDDNLELSLQRAAAVHRYLQSQGLSAERMYAAGFGDARQRETKKQSRRVEIVVTGEP